MHIKIQLYWYNFIQKINFHWCESHVISWIISMAKWHFALKFNSSNMCKFNWYILLLRFIFIHVSYFIMHGVKSHSFDNFPSFCFSFSSCPLFGELAKNIDIGLQGVMAHWCSPLWDPRSSTKGPGFMPNGVQVIVCLLCFNRK